MTWGICKCYYDFLKEEIKVDIAVAVAIVQPMHNANDIIADLQGVWSMGSVRLPCVEGSVRLPCVVIIYCW